MASSPHAIHRPNTTDEQALLQVAALLAHQGVRTLLEVRDCHLVAKFEDGFFKSDGMAFLQPEAGRLFLHTRHGEKSEVLGLDDVVRCSKDWHERSRDRWSGWQDPPPHWAALYASVLSPA